MYTWRTKGKCTPLKKARINNNNNNNKGHAVTDLWHRFCLRDMYYGLCAAADGGHARGVVSRWKQ